MVAAFIARTGARPWQWGVNDCALWSASCWAELTGDDPAAALRGTYGTAFQCRRVIMGAGGLLTLSRRLMAAVDAPHGDGDGVAVAKVRGRTIAGIMSGGRLWLKTERGVMSPEDYTILDKWAI